MKLLVLASLFLAGSLLADEKEADVGTVIGIDLGTTYSCVGVFKNGRVEIIANDQGNRITPSYVAFTAEGERLVGDAAKNQLTSNPENTVFDAKRMIGREWTDKSVQNDIKFYPFKVIEKSSNPPVKVETGAVEGDKMLTSGEISALNKMEETTETYHAIQGEGDVTFSTPPTLAPSLLEILSPSVVRLHPSSVRAEGAYRGVPVQEGGQEQLEITLGHPAQDTLPLPQEVNLDVGGFATRSRREAESSCLCRLIIPPQILLLPGYIILLLTSLFAYCALGLYYLAVSIYLQQTLKLRYLTFPYFSPRPPACTLRCPPACSCHSPCAWSVTRWSCMVGPPPC